MPQVSLYIDRDTLTKLEKISKLNHISISKWVGNSIREVLSEDYPKDYFSLFGAISDSSFKEPAPLSFSNDSKREVL